MHYLETNFSPWIQNFLEIPCNLRGIWCNFPSPFPINSKHRTCSPSLALENGGGQSRSDMALSKLNPHSGCKYFSKYKFRRKSMGMYVCKVQSC